MVMVGWEGESVCLGSSALPGVKASNGQHKGFSGVILVLHDFYCVIDFRIDPPPYDSAQLCADN